ncbi:lipid-A-disaccharide synthase [Lusitaniella coriacea LEGE 07157]|uniref:Lipid-A-disaccharide synthase n=1 Tax=Lusitaniella coriacea LEGE 07157 TaxID=945747 RepID=A0A8J7DVB4_9CYAN|nr:lipid-A-disaccharide synthase [Lusitaniella coriacea]MBE9115687.1 lipid-A-disaccharide synthase [Lusitaniella coriacea LEGE 07157]
MGNAQDILILSNGPGELTTWVRPVVRELRRQLSEDRSQLRISVILSPCPNATGKEADIARSYPEIDRVQAAKHFFPFLLWGKTAENWDWRDRGIVLFLGGDQLFPVIIGKRLGYRTVIYAEWDARWWRWVDAFGVMNPSVRVPPEYQHKLTVVGDLMADVDIGDGERLKGKGESENEGSLEDMTIEGRGAMLAPNPGKDNVGAGVANHPPGQRTNNELIGLLPGSKGMKLRVGVPLCCAIAEYINQQRPQTRFFIPVAPTLDVTTLAQYADSQQNPVIANAGNISAELIALEGETPFLKTSGGVRIDLVTQFPAYDLLSQCRICLTTIGANTAELSALAVPMLVLLPTQQLDTMRAWDGIPGILVNLPGVGSSFAKLVNWFAIQSTRKHKRLYAWPNIWAKEEIVPELLGKLEPQEIGAMVVDYLEHPKKLSEMRDRLRKVRGESGAAEKLARLVCEELVKIPL